MDAQREFLQGLSIRQLKGLILKSGLEHFDCIEKHDLVQRAVQAQQQLKAPPEPTLSSELAERCEAAVAEDDGMAEAQRSSVVRLRGLLTDADIEAIHALAARLRGPGSKPSGKYGGAWDTCYLSAGGAFVAALPAIAEKLFRAAREVDAAQGWNLLSGKDVAPRVVEYHTVTQHGSLPWARHFDEGSLLTIDCMLSDTAEFGSGAFQTLEPDGTLLAHPFERGDVQIFRSHKYHCVEQVSSGTRRVLVIELWDGPARSCAHRCGRRLGVCPLECSEAA